MLDTVTTELWCNGTAFFVISASSLGQLGLAKNARSRMSYQFNYGLRNFEHV